jgi:hypothetical protein
VYVSWATRVGAVVSCDVSGAKGLLFLTDPSLSDAKRWEECFVNEFWRNEVQEKVLVLSKKCPFARQLAKLLGFLKKKIPLA